MSNQVEKVIYDGIKTAIAGGYTGDLTATAKIILASLEAAGVHFLKVDYEEYERKAFMGTVCKYTGVLDDSQFMASGDLLEVERHGDRYAAYRWHVLKNARLRAGELVFDRLFPVHARVPRTDQADTL